MALAALLNTLVRFVPINRTAVIITFSLAIITKM
jgi:hypothetical protein